MGLHGSHNPGGGALPLLRGNRAALEATWKFVFICSVGIALAFVGILLLSMGLGPGDTLFFADLEANARGINPFWLGLSIPFLLVGFGTKVGLAPVHALAPRRPRRGALPHFRHAVGGRCSTRRSWASCAS